ncbi:MAG: LytTR family DNA-binding domain-containing protein [Saprospiraceae bacterium]
MKVVLIDDEQPFREGLKTLLDLYCPQLEVLGEANGVQTGLDLIAKQNPQLVFLDVQMQDGTGLDLLRQIGSRTFEVIFTTAFDHFAMEAIKLSALDYLLKPVDPEELLLAVEKAEINLHKKNKAEKLTQMEAVFQNFLHPQAPKKLVLKDAENIYLVEVPDIVRCEAAGSYTRFHFIDGKEILVSNNLREYENLLKPHDFYRPHHSHLFNLHQLDRFEKSQGGFLVMKDGSKVPVSVRRKDQILQLFANYWE